MFICLVLNSFDALIKGQLGATAPLRTAHSWLHLNSEIRRFARSKPIFTSAGEVVSWIPWVRGLTTQTHSHILHASLCLFVCLLKCVCVRFCYRDLVKNGVVCPGADAELAALHPRRLLFAVSRMRAADPHLRHRPQWPGKMRDTESSLHRHNNAPILYCSHIRHVNYYYYYYNGFKVYLTFLNHHVLRKNVMS